MAGDGSVVVVGGTRAIGLEIVKHYAAQGREVVLTGQTPGERRRRGGRVARAWAAGRVRGLTFDLARPHKIAGFLSDVGPVEHLVLAAIDRDHNTVAEYHLDRAIRLVTLKLVGYTAVVSALRDRLSPRSSVVLFGGMAKERPYPGSTTVTTVNGGVVGLTRTLVEELKPIRVNSIHPGVVGDSPYWSEKPAAIAKYTVGDADPAPLQHGRDRRRGGVPAREQGRQRGRPDRRRRLALPVVFRGPPATGRAPLIQRYAASASGCRSVDEGEDLERDRNAFELLHAPRLEAEVTILDEAPGARRDHDVGRATEGHDPGGCMDRDTADVTRQQLDLARMDADLDGQPDPGGRVTDRGGTADRTAGAGEHRQEAVAGRVHLFAEVALEPAPDEAIVLTEHLFPRRVPDPAGGRGRIRRCRSSGAS